MGSTNEMLNYRTASGSEPVVFHNTIAPTLSVNVEIS